MGRTFPPCAFHALTGWACPSCGMTRATLKLLAGDIPAAFAFNPLYVLGLLALATFNLYAITVLVGKLPRLRVGTLPPCAGAWFRWVIVAAILGNWGWLLYRGV
ncbi:MAG: DUF2752 domain-containing protein [Verrucomicrobiaceae bacterium]|nr:MAG: DUF2752 domain-containing protein [Verrucomicrobiaceae bacterium]